MDRSDLQGTHVVIVGGAGFVGSNLTHALLEHGVSQITVVDNFLSSLRENVPKDHRVELIVGSIADDQILERLAPQVDYVWHLACYHGNQSSIADPLADHNNNLLTSLKLFQHLSTREAMPRVIYAAAGCAVAEKTASDPTPTPEDAPISLFQDSPYSISKIVGEMYGNFYFKEFGLPFIRARFQNVYGPREVLGAGQWRGTPATVWRNVVPTFIWNALRNKPLILENAGLSSRDFIFVGDIVDGLIACALKGRPGEAYNLASGSETRIADLAKTIVGLTDSKSHVEVRHARSWDRSIRRFGSVRKSRDELGFVARIGLIDGLVETIDWTRRNESLISETMKQHDAAVQAYESQVRSPGYSATQSPLGPPAEQANGFL
jgi:UDP-glucose 4-epimerase